MTTRGDLLRAEIARIEAERGYYIPPYLMAEMMKTANKIISILITQSGVTYEECHIILDMVENAINVSSKEKSPLREATRSGVQR